MLDATGLLPIFAAPFVGSFLGVVAARLPSGRSMIWGRSACDSCGVMLAPVDLVPIVSWLVQRGRCRYCGASLCRQQLVLEIAAVVVAVWAAAVLSGWLVWVSCALGWTLLALAAIDQRYLLLPDELTLPLVPAGFLVAGSAEILQLSDRIVAAAAGFLSLWVLAIAYSWLRGREGMGLGDAKIMAAAGAWVGVTGLGSVLLIATLSALALVAAGHALKESPSRYDAIAFGPHLCLGLWLVWLYGPLVLPV